MSLALRDKTVYAIYGTPDKVRKLKDDYSYEIRNMQDGSKLFVFYTSDRVYDIWRLKKLLSPEDFKKINVGKSNSDNVKEIDPYCAIWDESGGKAISEHRLKGNEVAIIQYSKNDNLWIVNDIKYVQPISVPGLPRQFFQRIYLTFHKSTSLY